MATGSVLIVGTADTKGDELAYVADVVRGHGLAVTVVDVSTSGPSSGQSAGLQAGDRLTPDDIAGHHPGGRDAVFTGDRGSSVGAMAEALEAYVRAQSGIAGMLGIGGSGGTALITPAMRVLPVGTPKVMVSTVASGNVAPYVGGTDLTMMYSVTDVAGLNRISRVVLANAAHALAGMVAGRPESSGTDLPAVGLTMFGVTTPLVTALAERLAGTYEPLVFHATGTGGQSMEKLVDSGLLAGVLDMTTTEVADLVVGGVFPCLPSRFDVIAATKVPYVGSCGALDMVNFGARATVPERFADRLLHVHNPEVTLMRTTPEENARFGEFIAAKLNACDGEVRFLLPEGGVSLLDSPGQSFWDPAADAALFDAIERHVVLTDHRRVQRVAANINDPAFADAALAAFHEVMS